MSKYQKGSLTADINVMLVVGKSNPPARGKNNKYEEQENISTH